LPAHPLPSLRQQLDAAVFGSPLLGDIRRNGRQKTNSRGPQALRSDLVFFNKANLKVGIRSGKGEAKKHGQGAARAFWIRLERCDHNKPFPFVTAAGTAAIRERVASTQRIEIGIEDACQLAANSVCLGDTLVLSVCGERLRTELEQRAYHVVATPLRSFQHSGGAAFCLTLRLDCRSTATRTDLTHTAAA